MWDISEYRHILCDEAPAFMKKYIALPVLQRLSGVGLLCGTDWTPLYHNSFFYSRLDHSVGTALILWHFTHDKAQTISGLLHDVSSPAFSHVGDFRRSDTMKQTATESSNKAMLDSDAALSDLLLQDGLSIEAVDDYHIYPLADSDLPRLCADRLEYMFLSGAVLDNIWDMDSCRRAYGDIVLCRNEDGKAEFGFRTKEIAEDYCLRCCAVGLLLQQNENKLALSLLGRIIDEMILCRIIKEADLFKKSEAQLIEILECVSKRPRNADEARLSRYFRTFREMTRIKRSNAPLSGCFCVSLEVKRRYINPLVAVEVQEGGLQKAVRVSLVSASAQDAIQKLLSFRDAEYSCAAVI